MATRKFIWMACLVQLPVFFVFAQTKNIDSLKYIIKTAATNKEKLTAIFALCEQSINADSILP